MTTPRHQWSIPEQFNIGVDVVDRHAAAGTSPALIEVEPSDLRQLDQLLDSSAYQRLIQESSD